MTDADNDAVFPMCDAFKWFKGTKPPTGSKSTPPCVPKSSKFINLSTMMFPSVSQTKSNWRNGLVIWQFFKSSTVQWCGHPERAQSLNGRWYISPPNGMYMSD